MGNNVFLLEEEIRCDFVVSEKRKKIWKTQLDIAQEVKRICEKHHIKYFIIWGTLLGAVRHKGYIPWDDDFDIAFLRSDFERFCKIARKEIKSPLFYQDSLSDPEYFIGYARIRDSRTTGWILENTSPTYNNGIFIDLYPLDVIPEKKYIWEIQAFLINLIRKGLIKHNNIACKNKNGKSVKYKCLIFLYRLSCRLFDGTRHPRKLGVAYSPSEVKMGYWFYAKDVEKTTEMAFENTSFSAPEGYKNILKNVYGDYMKFPPKGKRGAWHEGQVIFEPDMPYTEFYKKKMRRRRKK